MFSHIKQNWKGHPLVCWEVVVSLIGSVTTKEGLRIQSELDSDAYKAGLAVPDQEQAKAMTLCPVISGNLW